MILLAGFTTSRNVGTECKSETQERIFLISIFMLLFSFLIFFFSRSAPAPITRFTQIGSQRGSPMQVLNAIQLRANCPPTLLNMLQEISSLMHMSNMWVRAQIQRTIIYTFVAT